MSTVASSQVRAFFSNLGHRLSFKKCSSKGPEAGRTVISYIEGGSHSYRLENMLICYFPDVRNDGMSDDCSIVLDDFNPDGNGTTDICKRCGCTQDDACEDTETGSCWWVHPDVCSACATREEKLEAMGEMMDLWREEQE